METCEQEEEVPLRVWVGRRGLQWLLPDRHFFCRQQENWQDVAKTVWDFLLEWHYCRLPAGYSDVGWPQSRWQGERAGVSCWLRLLIEHRILSSWLSRSVCFPEYRARRRSPQSFKQAPQKTNSTQWYQSLAWALFSESPKSIGGCFCSRSFPVRWTY